MARHQASGRFGLGLALASTTMLVWGVLPLVLQGALRSLDPVTLTWFRFVFASAVLFAWLRSRAALPPLRDLGRRRLGLLGVATVFLAANYLAYLLGLDRTDAATAQVLIQMAPLLLALGGIVVFREPFAPVQWLGFVLLVLGMAGFFGSNLRGLVGDPERYVEGAWWIVAASVTWAVYGMAQKQLLLWLPSQGIMLCIYVGSALIFTGGSAPATLLDLDTAGWVLVIFAAANTLIGYGTFAAALEHWEASRVSAVIALTPLATLGFTAVAARIWPDVVDGRVVSPAALAGAAVVVLGSLLVALGQRREPAAPATSP